VLADLQATRTARRSSRSSDDAAAAARRRAERPPALRWALLGGAPSRRAAAGARARRRRRRRPTYGLTEACSQVTTLGAPLFCTRVRAGDRRRDPRQRAHGRAGAPAGAAHRRPRGLDAGRRACRSIGARSTRSSRRRERRAAEVEAVLEAHPAWPRPPSTAARAGVGDGRSVGHLSCALAEARREDCAPTAPALPRTRCPRQSRSPTRLPRTRSGKLEPRRLIALTCDPEAVPPDEPRALGGGAGLGRARDASADARPVSRWLVDRADPAAGHTVSSSAPAAAPALLAAEPSAARRQGIITTAPRRWSRPRARAREAGRTNVDTARWRRVDRPPTASVDACCGRWGRSCCIADPETALRETRRVLCGHGGRVRAWPSWAAAPEANPWMGGDPGRVMRRARARDEQLRRAIRRPHPFGLASARRGSRSPGFDAAGLDEQIEAATRFDVAFHAPRGPTWTQVVSALLIAMSGVELTAAAVGALKRRPRTTAAARRGSVRRPTRPYVLQATARSRIPARSPGGGLLARRRAGRDRWRPSTHDGDGDALPPRSASASST
jgi:hypothetical protein